jgi:hypothetical protein
MGLASIGRFGPDPHVLQLLVHCCSRLATDSSRHVSENARIKAGVIRLEAFVLA